jgi:hypothetical protein
MFDIFDDLDQQSIYDDDCYEPQSPVYYFPQCQTCPRQLIRTPVHLQQVDLCETCFNYNPYVCRMCGCICRSSRAKFMHTEFECTNNRKFNPSTSHIPAFPLEQTSCERELTRVRKRIYECEQRNQQRILFRKSKQKQQYQQRRQQATSNYLTWRTHEHMRARRLPPSC